MFTWCKYEDHSSTTDGKDIFTKRKNQSKNYKYKVISPYKKTVCFSLPHGKRLRKPLQKPSRKPLQKWSRVFTKGFTVDNVKIFTKNSLPVE